MNGIEATKAIRGREGREGGHIPIIALTAHAMAGDREKCLASGMDAYASKPIRKDDLYEIIDKVVAQVAAANAARSKGTLSSSSSP